MIRKWVLQKLQWLTPRAADPYSFLVVVCRSCMSIAGTVFCSTVCKTIVIPSDQEEMQEKGKKARHQLSKVVKKWNLKHHFGLHFGSHFGFKIDVWEVLEPLGTTLDTTWDPQGHPGPKKNEKVILRRSPWDQVGTLNHYCRSHLNLQVHFATVFLRSFFKARFGVDFWRAKT